MNDNRFWLGFVVVAAAFFLGLAINAATYWKHENQLIAEMVLAGAHPVAAACAIQNPYGNQPTCVALTASKD